MLSVTNLEVVYNDVVLVLRGISLDVPAGEIVALLGANGAGKTTTMRAVTGLLDIHDGDVTKGHVTFAGVDVTHKDPSYIVKLGLSQVMEGRRIFAEMSVDENLKAGAFVNTNRKHVDDAFTRVMTLFPLLADRRKSVAGYMSGGEQQMLAIGRALMQNP
ncbi:MAG: ATP-binding cassette domain-containing protein [Acidimicrobiia bacterium]